MIALFIYVFSIMYTPGPVTTIAFSAGMDPKAPFRTAFAVGVAVAMYILLLVLGYSGQGLLNNRWLPWISIIGGIYIIYLGIKVILTSFVNKPLSGQSQDVGFISGFVIHLFNPKAWLAAFPLVFIYYPQNDITGWYLLFISTVLALICGGSSIVYNIAGRYFSRRFSDRKSQSIVNGIMGVMLLYSGIMILYEHVYLVLQ
ncbi:LysE family translocator [Biostraticola tofi]|uniref:Threonine/homoserine/homoserine lactone efflux protein n=1 Tax=Biostraticola tofi TaxID=466109 RepID=A0A4R3YSA4_9GAMM|nr:LysE family transporter [Biostraticola tofi]TCV95262.1 threonine/homoserine/homoserine lactone efflux protein [Biostraticola tofi]